MRDKVVKSKSNVRVVKHSEPKVNLPKIPIDKKLHKKLDKIELTKCLNHGFCLMGIGVPGSGKTSTIASWLESKELFNKVFDKIYLFMPENSFETMSKSVLAHIPEEQVYHELNNSNIGQVMEELRENSKEKLNSLVIFDDVQEYLKDNKIRKELGTMNANRRHLRTSIYFAVQYYKKVPKNTRAIASHLLCFNVSSEDLAFINKEALGEDDNEWNNIIKMFKKEVAAKESLGQKTFLLCDIFKKRYFIGWNEIVIKDPEDINEVDHNLIQEETKDVIKQSSRSRHGKGHQSS